MLNASSSGDCSLFLFQAAQLVLHFNQPVVLELVSLRAAEGIFDLSSPVVVAQSCTFFFFQNNGASACQALRIPVSQAPPCLMYGIRDPC